MQWKYLLSTVLVMATVCPFAMSNELRLDDLAHDLNNTYTLAVSCCSVYRAFDKFIPSKTGDRSGCSVANDCESTRLQFLVRRLHQLHGHNITLTDTDVVMTLNDEHLMSDFLISRMLAQFVSHEGYQDDDALHFFFDESSHNLKQVNAACAFEKDLYVVLLVISVSLLILCLLLQMNAVETKQKDQPSVETLTRYTPLINAKPTGIRYRLGSQS